MGEGATGRFKKGKNSEWEKEAIPRILNLSREEN